MEVTWEKPLPVEVVVNWLINDIVSAFRKGEIVIPQLDDKKPAS